MNAPVVLITGASSGIGKACARYLHDRGYKVYGTSRTFPCTDLPFETLRIDVDDDESVRHGVQEIVAREQRLDIAVNCAGFGLAGAVEDTSIDEAKAQFETNFFGAFRVCQAVLPTLRRQRSGLIVNISSIAGIVSIPFQPFYSASKFALEGLTEALRMEVAPFGIRVVLIEPGNLQTEFTARRQRTARALATPTYRARMDRLLAVMEKEELTGRSPLTVARLLEHIIREPAPTLRYAVGPWSERLAIPLKALIPFKQFERILMRHYDIR